MKRLNLVGAAHLTALMTVFLWGVTYISTKVLLRDFTPIEILFLRFLLGLGALSLIRERLPFKNWREERFYVGAGLAGVTLYFLFENIALTCTSASNVGILATMAPFFTALFAKFFLKEERLSTRFFFGFVLAISGVAMLSYSGAVTLKLNPVGDFLALLAAVVWAIYSILLKKLSHFGHSMAACTRRTFFYGLLFMIPALFLLDFSPDWAKLLKPVNGLNLLFLGLGASALCFASWNWAVKILGAVRTSIYIYLIPVITVISAVVILGEQLTLPGICGMALALGGLVLSETRQPASDTMPS